MDDFGFEPDLGFEPEDKAPVKGLYAKDYEKYRADYEYQKRSGGAVPGTPNPDIPKLKSYEEYHAERDKKPFKRALGVGETLLSLATGIPATLAGAAAGAAAGVTGKSPQKAFESTLENLTYSPRTEEGQDYVNKVGYIGQAFPATGAYVGTLGKMRKGKAAPVEKPSAKDVVAQEVAPAAKDFGFVPDDMRLESPVAAEIRIKEQEKRSLPKADDYNNRDANVRVVEEEIAAFEKAREADALTEQQALEAAEVAKAEEFRTKAQQDVLPLDEPIEGIGERPPQYGMTDTGGRVDENNIPIRADLSIEAQQLQDPLQRNLWGDELPGRTGDNGLPLTQALDKIPPGELRDQAIAQLTGDKFGTLPVRAGKWGQRGGIDLGPAPKRPSPQEVAKKVDLARKVRVMDLKGTPYDRPGTLEEVLANPGKDISKSRGRDELVSGIEGVIRLHENSPALKWARGEVQQARNGTELDIRQHVTGPQGLTSLIRKLSQEEKNRVVELAFELDKQKVPLSESVMDRMGFNDNQKALMRKMREADDALYARKQEKLGEQGFDATDYREGHVPFRFSGAYRTLVGTRNKDGSFSVKAVAQADTKIGMKKAVQYYKEQFGDTVEFQELDRTPLSSNSGHGRGTVASENFASLITELAARDPEFAKVKAIVDQKVADSTAKLYNHHQHELKKKGVEGALGNRPWLDANQNTNEFLNGYVDYLQEGFRYAHYQTPLNNISQLTTNPKWRSEFPNTAKYLDKYTRHLMGSSLNPVGAAGNWLIDNALRGIGVGTGKANHWKHEATHFSSLHMMGMPNLGFLAMQLTQLATGGIPEAAALRSRLQLPADSLAKSMTNVLTNVPALAYEGITGKKANVEPHMREAYQWAQDRGMFTFSESELAHQVNQSKARRNFDDVMSLPITLGEQATRPTVFLMMADMLKQAGYVGEDALLRAQTATDWAMANYHPDERPMIYQSLGIVGHMLGALTTYKHNYIGQILSRTKNGMKDPAALAATGLLGFGLYGVSGLPGYQEASDLTEKFADKTLREVLLTSPGDPSPWVDGVASWASGIDFQSRLSMSSLFPDNPVSAFPHVANYWELMDKALQVAKTEGQDKGAWDELAKQATPTGAKGWFEPAIPVEGKTGKNKYSQPRSDTEMQIRAAGGLRPLRERLEDESTWDNGQIERRRQEKLKDASIRFDRAILKADVVGIAKAQKDYIDNGGDIASLADSNRIARMLEEAKKSNKDRRAGVPTDNINSINKWKAYQP